MTTVIYADVYFIVNMSMDFTALFITAKIMNAKIGVGRFMAASVIGAIYAILSLFLEENAFLSLFLAFALPFIMCAVSFGIVRVKLRRYLLFTGLFWGVSFLMGGIISAVYMLLNKFLIGRGVEVFGAPDMLYSDLPLWLLGLVALLSAVFSSVFGRSVRSGTLKRELDLFVRVDGKEKEMKALYDSGNMLKEPISSLPVIVITRSAASFFFGERLAEKLASADLAMIGDEMRKRKMRLIPVNTVSDSAIFIGFVADEVRVSGTPVQAYLAIDRGEGDFGGLDAIIPSELYFNKR